MTDRGETEAEGASEPGPGDEPRSADSEATAGSSHDETVHLGRSDRDVDADATIQHDAAGAEGHDQTISVGHLETPVSSPQGRIGRYRRISELGQGGQGAVYLAEDERLRRRVALKVLFGGHMHSTEARLRFKREAEATGRLNHPGIAKIYEVGEAEGVPFIAMELVEGETLADRLSAARDEERDGRAFASGLNFGESSTESVSKGTASSLATTVDSRAKSLSAVARFMEDCSRALQVAHEAGLVHRDIKPGNIMVRPDGSPCILDFGLAHDESSVDAALTVSNARFGTPAYMSPEQVRGKTREVDRRTDIWALGATLYECCTLKRPFEAPTQDELFACISNEEPKAPRGLDAKIPKDLEAIILTALDKDQGRRYATAEDLAEDLRRFRELEPVVARPAGRLLKTVRWLQRNRVLATTGSIVMAALIGAAMTFYLKSEEARGALAEKSVALDRESAARVEKESALARETAALAERTSALRRVESERNAKQVALDDSERALADYDRLADLKRLEKAIVAADALYPPTPGLVPELEAWQKRHGPIIEALEGHRTFLAELRQEALPYSVAERDADFAVELAELAEVSRALSEAERALAAEGGEEANRTLQDQRSKLSKRLAELETLTRTGRRSWRFEDPRLQFKYDRMMELLPRLEAFANEETAALKQVTRRLDRSRLIAKETLEGEMVARWAACRTRVEQNPRYAELDLNPQLGLIPLGPDPDSGLEEFLHWLTHEGPTPDRDSETGRIAVTEELGIILVLIPGGRFLEGSQKDDPAKPNYDPDTAPKAVVEVELAAYFLSKYEMSQGQWQRAFRTNPSRFGPSFKSDNFEFPIDGRHPVEQVSWIDAQLHLPYIDLVLPTSSEWERAARAGTTDQIYAGCSDVGDLDRFANLNGAETKVWNWNFRLPEHEDPYIIHAPMGSFLPNAYGLHDMAGNVAEWCCLRASRRFDREDVARGKRSRPKYSHYMRIRGGSFYKSSAATALRTFTTADSRLDQYGLRPARVLSLD